MKRFVYALYYDDFPTRQSLQDGDPDEVVFYIGRTADPQRRLQQHCYEARHGKEDKYVFIRELEQKKIEWDLMVLREIEESDNRPWEYFYVIEFIRRGYSLKNMRYGDYHHVPTNRLRKIAAEKTVNNIDDLQARLKQEEGNKKPEYCSSLEVQTRVMLRKLRWLREESQTRDGRKKKYNIFDLGEGTAEIRAEFGVKKIDLARHFAPETQAMLRRLREEIGLSR